MVAGDSKRGVYERKYIMSGSSAPAVEESLGELETAALAFREQCAVYSIVKPTFPELALKVMREKHWNVEIFKEKTHLDKTVYSRIVNADDRRWSLRTVVTFCIGAGLGLESAQPLISAAGYSLDTSREHNSYAFLLTMFRGKTIDQCNALLEYMGFDPLGGGARKDR